MGKCSFATSYASRLSIFKASKRLFKITPQKITEESNLSTSFGIACKFLVACTKQHLACLEYLQTIIIQTYFHARCKAGIAFPSQYKALAIFSGLNRLHRKIREFGFIFHLCHCLCLTNRGFPSPRLISIDICLMNDNPFSHIITSRLNKHALRDQVMVVVGFSQTQYVISSRQVSSM